MDNAETNKNIYEIITIIHIMWIVLVAMIVTGTIFWIFNW